MKKRQTTFDAALAKEPWLVPYVEDGDDSLEDARRRFERDQKACLRKMEADGVELRMRFTKDGMLTTSIDQKAARR